MRRLATILSIGVVLASPSSVSAQDDPRLTQAVEHFRKQEYAEAGALFDEVAQETPSNLLNLNAMAAWYKADRCDEAMLARGRVDRTQRLEPQDVEDLDRVNAYCKLKSARAFRQAKEWDKALGLLAGLETQDEKLAGEIVALRQEIELDKQAAQQQAELDKPKDTNEPVEPPAEVAPAERPKWALHTGIGLLGGGAALGVATLIKWRVDQRNANLGWEEFSGWGCSKDTCGTTIPMEHSDYEELTQFESNIKTAETANVTMGITAGVAGIAGAAFIAYYLMSETPPSTAVAPMIDPDAQGIVFSLQF